jgi:hypothetical protein
MRTRPRHRPRGVPVLCQRHPGPRAPPPRPRGLVQVRSPTGPSPAAGRRRRRGSPPPSSPGLPAAASTGEVGGAATAAAVVATVIDAAGCGSTSAAGCCGSTSVAGCRGSTTAAASCTSAAAGSSTVVVATGRGSVASAALCEPPLAAVDVLVAAHDTLDERRLVGTAVSVLSTLAGARLREGAWWAPPCEHEDKKLRPWLI